MLELIIDAINQRKEIIFTYSGLNRTAQPAAVGESTSGNIVLRCFQTKGAHVTAGHEWDLCRVDQISNLSITENVFDDDPPNYRKGDRGMRKIFAEL
ncbi:hypothetical protein [Dickeya oryzae]|uniref:hypothetical protein n=1 Tax=Dickeya oryzae TaxID=1240404 RepID=UPI001AEC736B|nr:hypothetical protein [Dickeya oryzae]MBP2851054.1 hypothetical protein [Dickeya oryzae]